MYNINYDIREQIMTAFIQQIYQDQIRSEREREREGLLTNCFDKIMKDYKTSLRTVKVSECQMLSYLDRRGVEKSSHHVLTAAVGRQV